jgi:maleamate amidohydrolase
VMAEKTTADAQVFERQRYGARMGFGSSPVLVIVDFVNGFTDPALFGSSDIVLAIEATSPLLEIARRARLPVVFTRIVFSADGSDLGLVHRKVPRVAVLTEDNPSSQIVSRLEPRRGEIIIRKRHPSAFFATDLAALLNARAVDTVIVAGCSTSGCVHATVVDALGFGYRPIVVRECVADRHQPSHELALLNIDMKYGDVVSLDQIRAHLARASP